MARFELRSFSENSDPVSSVSQPFSCFFQTPLSLEFLASSASRDLTHHLVQILHRSEGETEV